MNSYVSQEFTERMQFSAVNCLPGGGVFGRTTIPLLHSEVDFLHSELDALLVFGDLQCYNRADAPEEHRILMGHIVCEQVAALCDAGCLPPANRIGVLIAGDLYAYPSLVKRGGTGDVQDIWYAFGRAFRWVAGVAGNHDLFEGKSQFPPNFQRIDNIHGLDGNTVLLDGLKIAGVCGIPGNLRKPWRYSDEGLRHRLETVLCQEPDVLILHQGPEGRTPGTRGYGLINHVLSELWAKPNLVAFGHCHWPVVSELHENSVYLNVDMRVALLTKPGTALGL